jgi:diguanylate cyclase (GGDEF)-like protein
MPRARTLKTAAVFAAVVAATLASIASVTILQQRAREARAAQLELSDLKNTLNELQSAPFRADRRAGGSPTKARHVIDADEARIERTLARLRRNGAPGSLDAVEGPLRKDFVLVDKIYELGVREGYGHEADLLAAEAGREMGTAFALLGVTTRDYDERASRADLQARVGSAVTILLLLGAFGLVFRRAAAARARAESLAQENARLLAASRNEARTDPLTGLRNRRALVHDLEAALARATDEKPVVLALFDLDGFKQYNDTFGHPAGDALLARLAEQLDTELDGVGAAYRVGGDEFCLLAPAGVGEGEALVHRAAAALSDAGDAFAIGCSFGSILLPVHASTAADALRLADQRMYAQKAATRSSARRQSTDVLLQVLTERGADLEQHLTGVARLAHLTAKELGLGEQDVLAVRLAAELHDVGKTAIPEAILSKPGPLDDDEWDFMRTHTLIGERIILAAPSLAHAAPVVRASHERVDGTGYPDRLRGDQIPLGARIVAVCDAFDAMVSDRPYRNAMSVAEACTELRRSAGTQFDPDVVETFLRVAERDAGVALDRAA